MTANQVMAKEMEAAGIMQTAQILSYNKPVYIVKALTDHESELSSDEDQASDYEHNFAVAMAALTVFVRGLVAVLSA